MGSMTISTKINKENNEDEIVCYTVKSKKTGKELRKPFKDLTYKRMISMTHKPKSLPEDEEEDAPKKEYVPYERIKVKFSTVWDKDLGPNDLKEIDTILFIPDQDEPVDATKVSEFEKYFSWKSTCKFGLMLNKFWIDKSDERNCSFGLKCVQLAVTKLRPEGQKKSANSQLSRNLFTGKKIARVEKVEEVEEDVENNDKVEDEVDNDEEFEEDEDEVDEDEEEEEEDEDEDEDEDEEDEEEDEEEEEPPVKSKRTKGGKKKPAKKAPVKVKGKSGNSKVKGKKNRK